MVLLALAGQSARADGPARTDDGWPVTSGGPLMLDAGLVLATPASLDTGLSTGLGAGASLGRRLALGLRGEWSSATESSLAWTVTQADIKLRVTAAVQAAAGRGRFALRLGLGPTFVRETRERNQGMRAGLTGADLHSSSLASFVAAGLDGVVSVHVAGRWLVTVSAGPSATLVEGRARLGWSAQVGMGWQP